MDPFSAENWNCRGYLQRRSFIKMGIYTIAAALSPLPVFAGVKQLPDVRKLRFYNLHTDERLSVCYRRNGTYDSEALKAVNYILRDHRCGEIQDIDRKLLDFLHAISVNVGSDRFHVISGYRSPTTNAALRRNGRKVASRSLHTRGKAVDIRMPAVDTQSLQKVALYLKTGGVGYYPGRKFVHVDVGPVRSW